jgi:hypothetical protein
MVLCVGGPGAGKSLLLSALCEPASFSPDSVLVPTVGVNIFSLRGRDNRQVDIRFGFQAVFSTRKYYTQYTGSWAVL